MLSDAMANLMRTRQREAQLAAAFRQVAHEHRWREQAGASQDGAPPPPAGGVAEGATSASSAFDLSRTKAAIDKARRLLLLLPLLLSRATAAIEQAHQLLFYCNHCHSCHLRHYRPSLLLLLSWRWVRRCAMRHNSLRPTVGRSLTRCVLSGTPTSTRCSAKWPRRCGPALTAQMVLVSSSAHQLISSSAHHLIASSVHKLVSPSAHPLVIWPTR